MISLLRKYWDILFLPALLLGTFAILKISGSAAVSGLELFGVMLPFFGKVLIKREIAFGNLLAVAGQGFLIAYFLPMQLYGMVAFCIAWAMIHLATYFSWKWPGARKKLKPSYADAIYIWMIFIGLAILVAYLWNRGLVGVLDYTALYMGLVGQALLINKKIQGWIILAICTVMTMTLFWTTASYLLFIRAILNGVVNVTAYVRWKKELSGHLN
ncbi:MAG: nicotinamide mononucleotide transporter family protein [Alphaproteobacteria bacterium]|nr:nicotinamide mononucleotide transporter family protein [Alphaproteobacteria bacterium]